MVDDPASAPVTPSASQDGIVVPTTLPSQALSELTPATPATPWSEPPAKSTLSAPASTSLETRQLPHMGTLQLIERQYLARQRHRVRLRDLRGRGDLQRDTKTMF